MRYNRLPVAALVALAAVLRFWGIAFGLPHTFARPDEEAVVSISLGIFQRDLNPHFFDWPSLYVYVVALSDIVYFNVGRVLGWYPLEYDFLKAVTPHPDPLFVIARVITAGAGVLTVWLLYRAGTRLFDRTTGLVAAALLAVAPLAVRDSHFGVPDTAATLMAILSFTFAVAYMRGERRRDLVLAAVFAGLAASTKYNAGLVVVAVAYVALAGVRRQKGAGLVRDLAIVVLSAGVAFVAGTPYSLLDWHGFASGLQHIDEHLRVGQTHPEEWAWQVHLTASLRYGLTVPLLATAIGGFGWMLVSGRRAGQLVALFPATYFLVVGAGHTAFFRYALPMVPFLCLSAAFAIREMARLCSIRLRRPAYEGTMAALLCVLIALPAAWSSVQIDRLLARTDNRVIAADWVRANYPNGVSMHQTGAIYGQLYFHDDSGVAPRYPQFTFDVNDGTFHTSDGILTAPPELIVVQRHPLAYSDVPAIVESLLSAQYVERSSLRAIDATVSRAAFDEDDAFYVPMTDFSAVDRPGPNISVYERRR